MDTKIIALLLLANICMVQPLQLTREIVPKNVKLEELKANTNSTVQEIAQVIFNSDILEDLISFIVNNQADTILKLVEKIEANSEDLEAILDIINEGLNANVLNVTNDVVKVDSAQLQVFFLNQAKNLVQSLYPKDILQQLMFYSIASEQIKTVIKNIEPQLANISVPLKVLAATLPKIQSKSNLERGVSNRVTLSTLISTVYSLFKTPICSVLAQYVALAETYIGYIVSNVTSLTIDTSSISNEYLQILALAYNSFLTFLEELAEYAIDVVELAYSSACSSSRKRRDLDEFEYMNRLTDVLEISPEGRSLRTKRSIFDTIYAFLVALYTNIIAPVLNTALKGFVSAALTYIQGIVDTFLNSTVLGLAYTLINTITLQS